MSDQRSSINYLECEKDQPKLRKCQEGSEFDEDASRCKKVKTPKKKSSNPNSFDGEEVVVEETTVTPMEEEVTSEMTP